MDMLVYIYDAWMLDRIGNTPFLRFGNVMSAERKRRKKKRILILAL